jgi:hypothetical protein
MSANTTYSVNQWSDWVVDWLTSRLSDRWEIVKTSGAGVQTSDSGADATIKLRAPGGVSATMVVVVKAVLEPADVVRLFAGFARTVRALANNVPVLVVAPWISGRTRELLAGERINYLDLTGNALVRLDDPPIYIEVQGAARDPSPLARGMARVQGPKAGRLIRTLADVTPPYGVRELAAAASLSPGYVSRLLETLESEAILSRAKRGTVESVDVRALLRRWAESYDIFRSNNASRFIAPEGGVAAVRGLRKFSNDYAVTGSFAAIRFEHVAAPTLLAVFTHETAPLIEELRLIPSDVGSNVVLLRPFDNVVFDRSVLEDGIRFVAPSQVAADCLTGNGRMPAEGEAVVEWMMDNESTWRQQSLPAPQ